VKSTNHNLEGRTCLITGATNGIGRVTAVALAGMGAELFLTYRDKTRADETVAEIRSKTGSERVHLLHAVRARSLTAPAGLRTRQPLAFN